MKDRQNNLLNLVLLSEFPIPLRQLEETFGISSRTLRSDVLEINEFLVMKQLPILQTVRNKGLFHKFKNEQISELKTILRTDIHDDYFTRDERILDIILDIAFGTDPVILNKKEELYYVSKSTVDEDMRILRKRLVKYNIEIISVPKVGLVFSGAETSIRTMLYSIVSSELSFFENNENSIGNKFSRIIENYFPNSLVQKVRLLFEKHVSLEVDTLHKLHFILFSLIWGLRIKSNHYIDFHEIPMGDNNFSNKLEEFISSVCNAIKINVPENELEYVRRILQSFNLEKDYNPFNWVQLQIMTFNLIQFVENRTSIPFSKKQTSLQQMLYNHIISMVTRVKNDVQLTNPLKEKIISSYRDIYEAVKLFSNDIGNLLGKNITDDEIAFLVIYFSTAQSELNQNNKYWYRAVVVCNHGIATGRLLSEKLKEFFNIEVIAVLSSHDSSIIDKMDVDIVFSTVEIAESIKPVLLLDSIIQEESKYQIQQFLNAHSDLKRVSQQREDYTSVFLDILDIAKEIGNVNEGVYKDFENIFGKYNLKINRREVQPMIQDLLSDENILISTQTFSWKESIQYVAQPLLEKQIISNSYIEAMIKSVEEYGPYIVIAPQLALAHARPEDGANQLGLSLAIFEKPVAFSDESDHQVQVVFCLSAIDSFSHLEVMKSLVGLIREKDKISKLIKAKDVQSIKQILFQS